MDFWKGKRTLITGGAGFIGSHLASRLLDLGARVRVADNLERGRLENLAPILDRIEFCEEDLRDAEAARRACHGMQVVFHLASKVGGIGYYLSRPAEVLSQNLLIDGFVLQGAVEAGASQYLYASSAHIYPIELQAEPNAAPIREEQALPAHPELSYGWAKLLGEKQLEYRLAEGAPFGGAIVRIIGAYGPNQDLDLATGSAIPVFIRRAIEFPERKPFRVLGSGRETRSYCYVSDVVEALILAVEKIEAGRLLGPLNVGREDQIAIGDLAREIIAISGKSIPIEYDTSHPTAIWGQVLDCSRARQVLGDWRARVPLSEGLQRMYADVEEKLQVAERARAAQGRACVEGAQSS